MGIKVERLFSSFQTVYIALTFLGKPSIILLHNTLSFSSGCSGGSIVVAASCVLVAAAFW